MTEVSLCTGQLKNSQPVNYNILLNPGSDGAIMQHAGPDLHLTVMGLSPFTTYYIRIQACQNGMYFKWLKCRSGRLKKRFDALMLLRCCSYSIQESCNHTYC